MASHTTSSENLPPRADVADSSAHISEQLFRLGVAFDGYTAQLRRGFAINAHERLALAALWERGPMTMTDLGAWIPLSRAAVTTLVDRLEASGLVTRSADSGDRRRTVVAITDVMVERMLPVVASWMRAVSKLSEQRTEDEWRIIAEFIEDFRVLNQNEASRLGALSDTQIQALAAPTNHTEAS